MWIVYEHRDLDRKMKRIPREILKRYEKWKDIIYASGPEGLRLIKGFHDEALKGKWAGRRSSRLGLHYRVIYRIERHAVYVQDLDITAHDYRRN